MRTGPWFVVLRAAVFSVVCLTLADAGHRLMSGLPVPPWTLLAGFAPLFGGALLLARRERSQLVITAGVLGAQAGLHELFTAAQSATMSAMAPMPGMAGAPATHGVGMLLAHVLAGLATGWWLRRGEAAAWSLLCLLNRWAARPARILAAAQAPLDARAADRAPVAVAPGRAGAGRWLRHCVSRRGPPALAL